MKRLNLLSCLFLLLLSTHVSKAEQTIRIGFADFPPFSEVKDGKCIGYFCEIAEQIFTQTFGITIEPVHHPWARIQRELEDGQIDVIFALPSEERRDYAFVSEAPIFVSPMKMFTYSGHERLEEINQIKTTSDIKALNLVMITNTGNGWHAAHAEPLKIATVRAISDKHILKMLAAHRGDVMVDSAVFVRRMIETMNIPGQIIETDVVLDEARLHLLMGRGSRFANLMPEINRILNNETLQQNSQ